MISYNGCYYTSGLAGTASLASRRTPLGGGGGCETDVSETASRESVCAEEVHDEP